MTFLRAVKIEKINTKSVFMTIYQVKLNVIMKMKKHPDCITWLSLNQRPAR